MIFAKRESKILECKSSLPKLQNIVKTCIAFANGVGGEIIIGVDDVSRKVIGVSDDIRKIIYDDFPNCLYDSTTPSLVAHIYERKMGKYYVIIIDVPSSHKKPCFLTKEGRENGVYLRVGSNTRKASVEYIEELARENSRLYYDEVVVDRDIRIFSNELLRRVYPVKHKALMLVDKVIHQGFHKVKSYHPTVTGILWFTVRPELIIPEALIMCTHFRGISGRNIIQTKDITGNCESQIIESFELIKSWIMRNYALEGVYLKGKTMIPEEALREAIINAVIHRKYNIPAPIKVALYDNRLEIFSPGCLPGLINIDHLGDGATYLRNPHLAKIARKIGLIEKLGTGVRLIFDSCKDAQIRTPEYNEDGDFVKLTFFFEKAFMITQGDEEKILIFLADEPSVTIASLADALHLSRNTITRKLNGLMKNHPIKRLGKGPNVRYILEK